jgi:type I restriction enzyme S subunit
MNATVSEQLPLLAAAPNGIKKLRELILELAVRGKLVAQDPSDEPAGELLKRIAAEKKRLVAEGKIKQPKPLAEIAEKERPFELPEGWEWVRLDLLLSKIGAGSTPLGGKQAYVKKGIKFLRSQNVWDEGLHLDDVAMIPEAIHQKMSGTHVEAGDLLFNITGASIGRCAVVPDSFDTGNVSQHVTILRPLAGQLKHFLHVVLTSALVQRAVMDVQVGVSREGLSIGKLAQFVIPCPAEEEQHRIVAKVGELMALCDRLEAQQADAESAHSQLVAALLDSLTQASDADDFAASWQRLSAHFHTLFTTEYSIDALKQTLLQLAVMGKLVPQDSGDEPASELLKQIAAEKKRLVAEGKIKAPKPLTDVVEEEMPFSLPKGWKWGRLGSQVVESGAGWSPSCEARPREGNEWGVLKVSAVSWGVYQPDENKALPANLEARSEHEVMVGDFLVSRANTADLVARSVVVETTPARLMLSDKIVRLKLTERCDRRYINLVNSVPQARDYYSQVAGGTSSSMKNVTREQILNLPIALPPLAEQHRIVAKVDQLMVLCDKLTAAIQHRNQHSRHLADALVDKALSPVSRTSVNVVDLSCYLVDRLVAKPTFGRTTHMKLIYLADTHLGFNFHGEYMREAAGPLDKNIYQVEKQAEASGWYTHTSAPLKSGVEKVTYHATDALAAKAQQVAEALADRRQELDRVITLLGNKKTEEVEIVATLFAAWNDALLDGQSPSDDWIIREVRENWHAEKQRFTAEKLGHWLDWMRKHHLIPTGKPPRTQHQGKLL